MARVVTAIYRTHATATLVRDEIAGLGVSRGDVHVLPDRAEGFEPGAERNVESFNDELHRLDLPQDDLRGYQQALRRGDHVVSVELPDDQNLDRVLEIMRHPEAHDLDALDAESRNADYVAPAAAGMGAAATGVPGPVAGSTTTDPSFDAGGGEAPPARRGAARRDAAYTDPKARTYSRDDV